MNTLIQVPFYGDTLEAVKTKDGEVLVHFKRVCESIGVDYASQLRKMRERSWCVFVDLTTQLQGDQNRRVTMITLESLPMWLANINELKVAENVNSKLVRYQRDAKNVLSAWFLGISSENPMLAAAMADVKIRLTEAETKIDSMGYLLTLQKSKNVILKEEYKDQTHMIGSVMQPFVSTTCEHMTIRDYCKKYGVVDDSGKPLSRGMMIWAGRAVSGMMAALGYYIPTLYGANIYRIDVLQAWRFGHDMKTKMGATSVSTLFTYGSRKAR
jgi:hypothetical protein